MASASHRVLLCFSILLGLLLISANARPCKTILLISSSSYSLNENPSFSPHKTRYLTFFFSSSSFQQINPKPFTRIHNPIFQQIDVSKPHVPHLDGTSFLDRTVDIMSVVGALLFGVGCGALTAATMYFVWSLFSPNRFDYGESDDEASKDADYDLYSPKKMGYVAIPDDTPVKQAV